MQPRILLSVHGGKARKIRFCIKWKNLSEPVMVHPFWTRRADTAIFSMPIKVRRKWTSETLILLICLWLGRIVFRSVVVWYVRKSWNKSLFLTGWDGKVQSVSLPSCTRWEYILSFSWTNGWNAGDKEIPVHKISHRWISKYRTFVPGLYPMFSVEYVSRQISRFLFLTSLPGNWPTDKVCRRNIVPMAYRFLLVHLRRNNHPKDFRNASGYHDLHFRV